jgi:hypothetical protein
MGKLNDKTSKWTPVVTGVIQGNVLGPTLLLLFIAEINEHPSELIELIALDFHYFHIQKQKYSYLFE